MKSKKPRKKYVLLNYERLIKLTGFNSYENLQKSHKEMIEESIALGAKTRQPQWAESLAAGSNTFTETIREKMEVKAKGRKIIETGDDEGFQLREETVSYSAIFNSKMEPEEAKNTYFRL